MDSDAKSDLYGHGSCHVFALAAALEIEAVKGFRIVFDSDEVSWEHPHDADGDIHTVVHVAAVAEINGKEMSLDVSGLQDISSFEALCRYTYGTPRTFFEDVGSPDDLFFFIEHGDGVADPHRPLSSFTRTDLLEARHAVRELFPDLCAACLPMAGTLPPDRPDIMVGPDGVDRLPESTIPQEVIDFLDEMTPGDVCKERIGDWNIQVEGFSGECMADIERRMNLDDDDPDLVETPEDVYAEVLDEFRNEAKGYAIAFLGILGDPEAEQPILACVDWAPDPEITEDMEMSP